MFPQRTITLGDKGHYLIGSTVFNRKDVVMTCDQEINDATKHTSPSSRTSGNIELSIDNLDTIAEELNILSGGRFKKHLDSARRSLNHGNSYFRKNPLAWSIDFLKDQLASNTLTMNKQTLVALGFLQSYQDVLLRWRNHAYFPVLAKEICAYFYHSLVQLIIASYLSDHGNKIAVNLADDENSERSADLYIRLSGSEKLFIEVKGPELFDWTNSEVSRRKIKKAVEKCLSKSRGQIDLNNPGILVIGATCLDRSFLPSLQKEVKSVLRNKGRNYKAVAGISIVGLTEVSAQSNPVTGSKVSTAFNVNIIENEFYFEENPIRTNA